MKEKIKKAISDFFYDTFRERTASDYKAVFSKNLLPDGAPAQNTGIPWLYLRVFCLFFTVFALIVCLPGIFDTNYSLGHEAVIFTSAVFCIPYLLLIFESMKKGSLSLPGYFAVFWIGGMVSLSLVFYREFLFAEDVIASSFFLREVSEEFSKGLTAIVILLLLKKRNPVDGVLIGSAVGGGFAFGEGVMNHVFITAPRSINDMLYSYVFNSLWAHIFWTALICYAFCKPKKPLLDPRFYLGVLTSCSLHVLWNRSIYRDIIDALWCEWLGIWLVTAAGIAGWIYFFRKLNSSEGTSEAEKERIRQPYSLRFRKRLSLMLSAVLLSGCMSGYISACEWYRSSGIEEKPEQTPIPIPDFIDMMQDSREIPYDLKRPFDPEAENVWAQYNRDTLENAEQEVPCPDGGCLHYHYRYDEERGSMVLEYLTYYPDGSNEENSILNCLVFSKELSTEENSFDYLDLSSLDGLESGKDYILLFNLNEDIGWMPMTSSAVPTDSFISSPSPFRSWAVPYFEWYIDGGSVFGYDTATVIRYPVPLNAIKAVFLSLGGAILLAETAFLVLLSRKERKKQTDPQSESETEWKQNDRNTLP